jgi:hypothetical protein
MLKKPTYLRWLMALTLGMFLWSGNTLQAQDPGLELLNTHLDLGERPIGAWMKPGVFEIINNPGKGDVTISAIEIDDNTGFLQLVNPVLPFILAEGETLEVGLTNIGFADDGDMFTGDFAVVHNGGTRDLVTGTYEAIAYTPDAGDVVEVAFDGNATAFPALVAMGSFRDNYDLPGMDADGWDNVYEFTFANDVNVDITLTAADAKMALYAADFGGEGGPDVDNALVSATTIANGIEVYAGTYYLVVSTTGADYNLNVIATDMSAPDAAAYIAPADGAINIINGNQLEWAWGANTGDYQVVLGTTYPPATVVQDWTTANTAVNGTFTLSNLNPNLQYFWQVNVRNTEAVTNGPIWGFTTTITPPAGLDALVVDGGVSQPTVDVNLTWESSIDGRAFLGYNIYRDAVQINGALVTSESYSDMGVARNASYDYNVTAVFDEGESAYSNTATVTTKGVGTVNGTITDVLNGTPLAGASVTVDGTAGTYNLTTAANGTYTSLVYAGTYDIAVEADGYIGDEITAVAVAHAATATNNFQLLEIAFPVDFVIATELSDEQVLVQWGFDIASFIPEVYPFNTDGMSQEEINKNWNTFIAVNGIEASGNIENTRALVEYQIWRGKVYQAEAPELIGTTSQTQFVDFEWDLQDWGVYEWYVVAVYTANSSVPVGSNPIDKDMETIVNVDVETNSGDSPFGTSVEFTNVSELDEEGEPQYFFGTILGANGMFSWTDFRRGTYNIEVSLPGFATITETNVDIFDETDFSWLLIELLSTPTNLYVTPTGFATWEGGSAGGDGFEPYFSDFEADNGGWVASADGLFEWGTPAQPIINAAYSGSRVWMTGLAANYPNSASSTLMREFDFSNAANPLFSAQLFIETENNFDGMVLESSIDGGATWQYVDIAAMYNSPAVTYGSFPNQNKWSGRGSAYILVEGYLTDLAGQTSAWLRLRFASDSSVNGNGIAIDDLSVTDMPLRGERAFVNYKVFHAGVLVEETGMTQYQYGTNGEVLVDGETYLAQVAAVYNTGQSAFADYTWTYIACDNYAVPGDFTAEQVIGTLDIQLSWTIPTIDPLEDQIDFARIFRNGEVIAEVDAAMYLDEELEFGMYEYCITFVYESGAETCVGEVCADAVEITGGAFVNGTVTMFDGGAPISGAEVTIINQDYSFTFITNGAGFYEGEVVAGTYDYLVGAEGFTFEILEDVTLVYGDLVTQDFVLMEYPYPVSNVVAEDQGNSALIYWNTPGTSGAGGSVYEDFTGGMPDMLVTDTPASSWSVANDMLNLNATGTDSWRSAYYNQEFDDFVYEVEMQRTAGAQTGSMGIYVRGTGFMNANAGSGEYANVFTITQNGSYWYATMLNGDLMGDWTGWLTTSAINTSGPNVLSAVAQGTTVQFFVNGTLVHTVNNTTLTSGYVGMFSHEGTAATTTVWDYMMVEPGAIARDYATDQSAVETKGNLTEVFVSNENTVEPKGIKYHTPKATSSRELVGYNVYRMPCGEMEEGDFLGFTLDSTFVDNQFGALASGVYKWAVEAVYTYNSAEPQFSNCLDVDMVTTVTVNVSTTSGDSAEETDVLFVNTSEPDLELEYEVELDETGTYMWEEFRKGTYDIFVEKTGFAPVYLTDVVIDGPTTFNWILEELLLPVEDLYVTPTGFATWRSGGELPFEPYFMNFNEGMPEEWTIVDGGSTSDTWFLTPNLGGSSLDGTPFMLVDSDGAGIGPLLDEMLYSPVINAENAEELYLMFDQYYRHLGSQYGKVEVYDGSDWVTLLNQTATAGAWGNPNSQMIDITDYINDELQVRFHFNDAAGWNWYWAVDNFAVVENLESLASRELQYYKVWLDNNFVADTENEFYQYNTENLVEGQSYLAEVAAVYSTGISARMQYVWTFMGCENFPGPDGLEAEVVNSTNVVLNWGGSTPPPPPGGDMFELSYHNNVPADAYYQLYNNGYGVVYNLSGYNNATIEMLDYRHSPWGVVGTWNYKVHIVDWDTYTLIEVTDVLQTTVNDGWELEVPLGSIPESGLVGIFVEPMSNSAADAYPCLDGDGAATTSSFFGPLPNWAGMSSAAVVGNFLMDLWIMAEPATGGPRQLVKAPVLEGAVSNVASRNPREKVVLDLSSNPNHVAGGSPATLRDDVILNYDGENNDAIGLTAGGSFSVAARYPAAMVNPYNGYELTSVQVYINDLPSSPSLKIWSAGSATAPGTLLVDQAFTAVANSWVTIELNTPVEIDGTDIWVGYAVTHGASQFPAGTDAGPANIDGAWISMDGIAWDRLFELAPTLNYNWNIRATLSEGNGGGGGGIPEEVLGANVYRNGELIAEMVQGDTYTDENVMFGDYTYCVTFVYEEGAESCFGDPCVDVEITCEAPINLVGEYLWNSNDEFGALIGWEPSTAPVGPVAEWIFYDDGVNVDGIGGPASFTWAIKFDPAQLADFEGASLTKIQIYNRLSSTDELRIYEGTNAATLLHSQALSGLAVEAWEEVDLTSAVAIDITKQLWIAVYTTDGVNFPAGCGAGQNQPNGDLITLDGVVWEHLTDFGLINTWNLRGFVTTAAGATVALPMEKPMDNYNVGERSLLAVSGLGSGQNNVLEQSSSRNLDVYNVYRKTGSGSYELIAVVPFDASVEAYEYYDTDVDAGTSYFYQVTAEFSYDEIICESAPAMALNNPEDDFVVVLVTSLNSNTATEARMYPNPASNNLTIEASAMQRLTVVNAIGQVVYDMELNTQNKFNLNTSRLEAGMYIIKLVTAEGTVTSRVNIVR